MSLTADVPLCGSELKDDIPPELVDDDSQIPSWGSATKIFEKMVSDGTIYPFSDVWVSDTWSEIADWMDDRKLVETTAMITLSPAPQRPPADVALSLSESVVVPEDIVCSVLSGTESRVIRVVGYNDQGYPHCHIGIRANQRITKDTLRPAVDRFVAECPMANKGRHGEQSITTRHGRSTGVRRLGQYLTDNVIPDGGIEDTTDSFRRGATATYVGNLQPVSKIHT